MSRASKLNTAVRLIRPAGLAALGAVLATPALALADDDSPQMLALTGMARDFKERSAPGGHPDFEKRPDGGFGHYVGNVAIQLGEDGKPVWVGGGRKVHRQATNSAGMPIAPHLANAAFVEADGINSVEFNSAVLDDSGGDDAYHVTLVSVTFNDDGTSTWRYRVEELPGGRDLSHWNVKLDPSHEVVADGTTPGYDFGTDGSTGFFGIKWDVGDGFSEGVFSIVLDGHYLGQDTANGVLAKGGHTPDTGDMFVPGTEVSTTGSPFPSGTVLQETDLGDEEADLGSVDSGGVQSAESFDQWFRNHPGLNIAAPLTLILRKQEDGTYVFDSATDAPYDDMGGFFPIDDRYWGNSGGSPDHNFHFTFELHAEFAYDEDGTQFFRFTGDDDVWVFIDDKLVIDLGGVHGRTDQVVDLNRLGLEDGETYEIAFFFAERHRTQSNFRIQTNLNMESLPLPTISASFD